MPSLSNFDSFENGRFRTRVTIPEPLKPFFFDDKTRKYKSALIANYNGMSFPEAEREHYLNLAKFKGELAEAQELLEQMQADGYTEVTSKLIAKYKAHRDCRHIADVQLNDARAKSIVRRWFQTASNLNEEQDDLLLLHNNRDSDRIRDCVENIEIDLGVIEEGVEEVLPSLHRTTDKLLLEAGIYVETRDYSTPAYRKVLVNVKLALIELYNERLDRLTGIKGDYPKRSFLHSATSASPIELVPEQPSLITWAEFSDKYVRLKVSSGQVSPTSQKKFNVPLRAAREVFGETALISQITTEDCVKLLQLLKDIPVNVLSRTSSAGLPLAEVIEIGKREGRSKRRSRTVAGDLNAIKSIFKQAIKENLIATSPVAGLDVQVIRSAKKGSNLPYSIPQLNRMIRGDEFADFAKKKFLPLSGQAEAHRDSVWVILVAMFTGARQNEIVQLRPQDVFYDDRGIPAISIDAEDGKKVKNTNSIRLIPVHPILESLGIMEFAKKQGEKESAHLFGGLNRGQKDPAGAFGKWFGRFLSRQMDKDDNSKREMTFHSFRSTVAYLAENESPGMDTLKTIKSMGWGENKKTTGELMTYVGEYDLRPLYDNICKLQFPGLDVEHLIN